MFFRRVILLVVSLAAIGGLYKTEFITNWLGRFIFPEDNPMTDQFDRTDIEERRARRFGNTYMLCQYMTKTLDTSKLKTNEPIILLPPNAYLKSVGSAFNLPEPAEIYYHCGLKTVWTTSPDVEKANWAVVAMGKGNIAFVPLTSKDQLQELLNTYKNFKPTL